MLVRLHDERRNIGVKIQAGAATMLNQAVAKYAGSAMSGRRLNSEFCILN
jgi:hypothetical protein